jgi:hypothetical protein
VKNLTDVSKEVWRAADPPTIEQINCGSLQRIAAATELMAKRYQDLIDERDRFKNYERIRTSQRDELQRTVRALKGVITKFRKKEAK